MTHTQQLLFSTTETNKSNLNFQIKRFDDPSFGIVIKLDENEDPEVVALEQLGYFVVPETVVE